MCVFLAYDGEFGCVRIVLTDVFLKMMEMKERLHHLVASLLEKQNKTNTLLKRQKNKCLKNNNNLYIIIIVIIIVVIYLFVIFSSL